MRYRDGAEPHRASKAQVRGGQPTSWARELAGSNDANEKEAGVSGCTKALADDTMSLVPHFRRISLARLARTLAGVGLVGACGGGSHEPTTPASLASLTVTITYDSLRVGEAARVTARGQDARGVAISPDVTWSTTNTAIATVGPNGIVTAVGAGQARIIATAGSLQADVGVTVYIVPVAAIVLSPARTVVAPGEFRKLEAIAVDAAGRPLSGRKISWLSSDPARVEVSSDGIVTGLARGITAVSAISEGVYSSVDVRVSGPPGAIAAVAVTPEAVSLTLGQSQRLTTVLEDAEGNVATDRVVRWRSLNPDVASVDAMGVVTAIKNGAATIEAICENGRGTSQILSVDPQFEVKVTAAVPDTSDIIGDTLTVIANVVARFPIQSVVATVANKRVPLALTLYGPRNVLVWYGTEDMSDVRFGPYQLVITAVDEQGNRGVLSIPVKRGTRVGAGGTSLPPKPR